MKVLANRSRTERLLFNNFVCSINIWNLLFSKLNLEIGKLVGILRNDRRPWHIRRKYYFWYGDKVVEMHLASNNFFCRKIPRNTFGLVLYTIRTLFLLKIGTILHKTLNTKSYFTCEIKTIPGVVQSKMLNYQNLIK